MIVISKGAVIDGEILNDLLVGFGKNLSSISVFCFDFVEFSVVDVVMLEDDGFILGFHAVGRSNVEIPEIVIGWSPIGKVIISSCYEGNTYSPQPVRKNRNIFITTSLEIIDFIYWKSTTPTWSTNIELNSYNFDIFITN